MNPTTRVGFIGLGNMGAPLAANIARCGFETVVYDLRPDAMQEACQAGAHPANSVADVACAVDVLCSCVLYEQQVNDLYCGEDGVFAAAKAGLITMVHSTITPGGMRRLSKLGAQRGVVVLDAAVTGGSARAGRGEVTSMVSGPRDEFETARPILESFSSHCFYVGGEAGQAQIVKLANNLMAHVNQIGVMEALYFAEEQGIDPEVVLAVAATGTGGSWAVENHKHLDNLWFKHTLAGTEELPHRLTKDLRIAIGEAQQHRIYLPLAGLAAQLGPAMWQERWLRLSGPHSEPDKRGELQP